MRTLLWGIFGAIMLSVPSVGIARDDQQRAEWNRPFVPFRIIDNVYYVGTKGLSAFLVTSPQGHVLIDGGLPESAPIIAANIQHLGFKLHDIKYLLINHTHFDHAGGLAALKRLTGAKLIATAAEKSDLDAGGTVGRPELSGFPRAQVDRIIRNGDNVRVGGAVLTAIASPGHTRGGVSWLMTTANRSVLFATSLTVAGQKLAGDALYPDAASDFRRTFARLRTVRADVFLNFHPEFFRMEEKRARQIAGDANAFVDSGELTRQLNDAEAGFNAAIKDGGALVSAPATSR